MKSLRYLPLAAAVLCPTAGMSALITTVTEVGDPGGSYADPVLVQGGFGEDVDAFTDRTHEWNGSGGAQPTVAGYGLQGADYVRTANDARAASAAAPLYEFGLSQPAYVYTFVDSRPAQPQWLADEGWQALGTTLGVDEGGDGVGPGAGINNNSNVYVKRFEAGTHSINGMGTGGINNYGFAATTWQSAVGSVRDLATTNAAPALQRLGFGDNIEAYTDRVHQWVSNPGDTISDFGIAGFDYIQTANDAKSTSQATDLYEVTLLSNARSLIFWDDRSAGSFPQWALDLGFADTGFNIGIDEGADGSINQQSSVYETFLTAGTYRFGGAGIGGNNYGLAFAIPEPSRALFLLVGALGLALRRRR
ncbi:MAG: hypothetical protein R3F11_01460 [Verrucomicrobiales bacterium]